MILTLNPVARESNGEHHKPSVVFIILGIIAFGLVLLAPFILCRRGCHRPEPYQLGVPVPQRAGRICLTPHALSLMPITCYRETEAVRADTSKQVVNPLGQTSLPSCLICISEFRQGAQARSLPCGHRFHPRCIDPWLLERSINCPVCRANVADALVYKPACDLPPAPRRILSRRPIVKFTLLTGLLCNLTEH
ncbi:hypothetical protein FVEG_14895 [Fusarium verticillioides 7600]|uniref:RING-type domain-containing protein n=1 Tax=Gibberella moniliformis (strain M3125 / FGSC 7600) TaxID=334819 RepID=W7LSN2_GIBM7|nr:hypothetical protein FVEG_14895 [Fusarium verticillioides 7600]EWG38475.1 hypothetical protein FVEG_14895 [Fusarium verticillioides 7600]